MTLKTHCTPRQSVFDRNRRDIVLDLSDFLEGKIEGEKFFEENFITSGMKTLFEKTFARLENRGDQASTFLLTQSMGGGKTHNMIALGLLAKNPALREKVLGKGGYGSNVGGVRVIGFHGRQTDAQFGIWGELADQLGKKDVFKDYYQPLQAPGQSAWINLLRGEPTLIFLDELPPYLEAVQAKSIGSTTLSTVTATAIANLLVAVNKAELSNVCVVIADLTASWQAGGAMLNTALDNLNNETSRLEYIFDLFGQIPDVLESLWIDVAQGEVEDAKRLIDGIQQTHPFDDRYAKVENLDWESCAKVLSATEMQKLLSTGW